MTNEGQGSAETRAPDATGDGDERFAEDDITIIDPDLRSRAVAAAAVGNAVEWFDFGVFSYLAVTIGLVFFPTSDPSV